MSEVTVTITNTDVNLTETYTTLSLGNAGPQGIPGDTGPTGPKGDKGDTGNTGPSGVIAVTAPITNTGTSTSANIGVDQTALVIAKTQVSGTAVVVADLASASVNFASTAGTAIFATNAGTASYSVASGTAVYATNSGTAVYSTNAGTAVYSINAGTAVYATNAGTAFYADTSGTAVYGINAGTAVYATNAGTAVYATNAGTAVYANTAGTAAPSAHASTHASDGSDAVTLAQSQVTNLETDLGARVQTANLQGLLSQTSVVVETVLRQNLTANSMFSGNMIYCFFTPLVTVTVSQITMASGGTAGTGATTTSMGLFTVNSSDQPLLVARTAVDTTLFQATNTVYTRSFDTGGGYPATYTLVAGTRYAVGVNSSGGTTITLSSTTSSSANGAVLALAPRIAGVNGGTAGLPTTLQTGLINVNFCVWARLS